eukprot:3745531-Rhodomonas_salina.1
MTRLDARVISDRCDASACSRSTIPQCSACAHSAIQLTLVPESACLRSSLPKLSTSHVHGTVVYGCCYAACSAERARQLISGSLGYVYGPLQHPALVVFRGRLVRPHLDLGAARLEGHAKGLGVRGERLFEPTVVGRWLFAERRATGRARG